MAKMRKRTKVSLILLAVMGVCVAVAAGAIGLGAVALFSQLVAADIAILSAGVAACAGIAAGSFAISGLVARKKSLRKSAESVAQMATVGQRDMSKDHSLVKVRDNSLKAAKNFVKSSYKLSKFGISPITHERVHYGQNKDQLKLDGRKYVYGLMNEFYAQNGKTGKARKFDKKKQNLDKKLSKLEDVSALAPKYHVSAEFFNPVTSLWEKDERSSVYFNNEETAKVAKKLFDDTTFERYSDANKKRGATTVTIRSRGNSQVKEVNASCNAVELVDSMEALALMDYAMSAQKTGISGYPIIVETQEHKLDGSKKGKAEVMQIKNEEELKRRVYDLNVKYGKSNTNTYTQKRNADITPYTFN